MGSKMLKVMGILCIIFGAIAIVINLIAFGSLELVKWGLALLGKSSGAYTVALVLAVLGAACELVAGIFGVINWAKPEKANLCVILGCATVALALVSNLIVVFAYSEYTNVFSIISGLAVPVLYLIAAFQLKKLQSAAPVNY